MVQQDPAGENPDALVECQRDGIGERRQGRAREQRSFGIHVQQQSRPGGDPGRAVVGIDSELQRRSVAALDQRKPRTDLPVATDEPEAILRAHPGASIGRRRDLARECGCGNNRIGKRVGGGSAGGCSIESRGGSAGEGCRSQRDGDQASKEESKRIVHRDFPRSGRHLTQASGLSTICCSDAESMWEPGTASSALSEWMPTGNRMSNAARLSTMGAEATKLVPDSSVALPDIGSPATVTVNVAFAGDAISGFDVSRTSVAGGPANLTTYAPWPPPLPVWNAPGVVTNWPVPSVKPVTYAAPCWSVATPVA